MNHCPCNHNIVNIMDEPVEFCVKGSLTCLGFGVDIRAKVFHIEGTEPAVCQIENCIPVDVEHLWGMAGGVDSFIVASVDAASYPENLVWPPDSRVDHVQPIRTDWQAVWFHVEGVLGSVLESDLVQN